MFSLHCVAVMMLEDHIYLDEVVVFGQSISRFPLPSVLIVHSASLTNVLQYKSLLDMKQRQANVDEAVIARKSAQEAARQGRAIMVFTVFTIVFLPLSFFTSLFGMNTSEWSGDETNLSLHTIGVLMGAISFSVILVAFLIAFNEPIRVLVLWCATIGLKRLAGGITGVITWPLCICRGSKRRHVYDEEMGLQGSWWSEKSGSGMTAKKGRKDFWGRWKENVD